jgi:beta-1,4-N-acetylglucosaminyltransferase
MKIGLVCTRGGHLTEIFQLLDAFKGHEIFFVTPHSVQDRQLEAIAPVYYSEDINAHLLPFISLFKMAFQILQRERPAVILSTGPEIALPFYFWGRLMGMKTIYIESWCRVDNLSITGRLVYPWVDEFWVQWPQLLNHCGHKAKYKGAIL